MNDPPIDIFEALGHPIRREILERLAAGEMTAGDVGRTLEAHARLSQPAVSQHLKVLREAGLVTVRALGTKRIYAIERTGVDSAHSWLNCLAVKPDGLQHRLDALATEVARGRRERRQHESGSADRSTSRLRRRTTMPFRASPN